jgi:hypothetical protein
MFITDVLLRLPYRCTDVPVSDRTVFIRRIVVVINGNDFAIATLYGSPKHTEWTCCEYLERVAIVHGYSETYPQMWNVETGLHVYVRLLHAVISQVNAAASADL